MARSTGSGVEPRAPESRLIRSGANSHWRRNSAQYRSGSVFASFSGGSAVTGWIAAFFPYFKDGDGVAAVKNPWLAEGGEKLRALLAGEWDQERFDLGGPSPGDFPGGLARAPFVWEYLGAPFDMELLGGFVGVAQDPATLALLPEVGWAVREVGRAGGTTA